MLPRASRASSSATPGPGVTCSSARISARRAAIVASTAGAVLVCTSAFFPLWLKAFRVWMKFAEVLSWVMTRVLLSIFFFLVLTPTGLVMRLFGRAPLDLAWKDGRPTYWIDKPETEHTVERYEKQF